MTVSTITTPSEVKAPRTPEELVKTISASRLTCWLACRLKFWFRYLSGITKPKPPALALGSAVHETLKFWNRARWHRKAPTLTELHAAYLSAWKENTKGIVVEDEDQTTGWRLCETLFRETPIRANEKPEAVEASVEADLSAHGLPKLIGVLDLVRSGGRIVDFKTTGRTPEPEQLIHTTEVQTSAYALLYRESTGLMESGIELHSLVKTKSPKLVVTQVPPADSGKVNRLLRLIQSHVDGVLKQDFVPSPGMQCSSCEFFNECRAWTGATPLPVVTKAGGGS